MFGYLFPTKEILTITERKIFRDYYCTLCLAHRYRYGRFSSLLNNFDMGIFAIVLNLYENDIEDCARCGKKVKNRKEKFTEKKWGDIVDYSINLIRKKIEDDLIDNPNSRTKILYLIAKGIFRRCRRNNQELYDAFDEEYSYFTKAEAQNLNIDEILDAYESFSRNTLTVLGCDQPEQVNLFASLNRWVYWIDAINDYDEDLNNGTYNPYISINESICKSKFLENNMLHLINDYEAHKRNIASKYSKCLYSINNSIIIENVINHTIKNTTKLILENNNLPKRRKLL
jgi:hypothetical protein